jgi:anaerobic selenocysteine-containing dehydrogenase
MAITRRDLFKRSAVTGAGLLVAGNLDVLFNASPAGAEPGAGAGPLVADRPACSTCRRASATA